MLGCQGALVSERGLTPTGCHLTMLTQCQSERLSRQHRPADTRSVLVVMSDPTQPWVPLFWDTLWCACREGNMRFTVLARRPGAGKAGSVLLLQARASELWPLLTSGPELTSESLLLQCWAPPDWAAALRASLLGLPESGSRELLLRASCSRRLVGQGSHLLSLHVQLCPPDG